jgi:hypothetical protein
MSDPSTTRQAAPPAADVLRPAAPSNNHDHGPQHPLAGLHQAFGNLGVLQRMARPALQPKLEVGAPDDEHEREADKVADAVMRKPDGEDPLLLPSPDAIRRAPEDKKKPPAAGGATQPAPPKGKTAAAPAAATAKKAPAPAAGKKDAAKPKPGEKPKAGDKPKPKGAVDPKAAAEGKPGDKDKKAAEPKGKPDPKRPQVAEKEKAKPGAQGAKPAEKPKTGATAHERPPGEPQQAAQHAGGPPQRIVTPPSQTDHKPEERKPDEPVVAAKAASPGTVPAVTPSAARTIQSAQGGGQPLGPGDRSFYESRLGRDLGNVRVHDDAAAHHAARDVKARAFTYGQDIFFAAGRHQPGTDTGRELMAHELAHTIQQRPGAKLDRKVQRAPNTPAPAQPAGAGAAGVTRDPATWTITFPQLEVPAHRKSGSAASKYAGPLTRPKGYSRKGLTPQRDVWISATQGDVAGQVPAMLTGIKATMHENRYFVRSHGSGLPERYYVGTPAQLGADLTTPEWDSSGKGHGFRGFEVDHVLELQLGGTNTIDNLELLDKAVNSASGNFIMQSIDKTMSAYLDALPASEKNDSTLKLNDWRANWNLTFQQTVPPTSGAPKEPADTDRWTAAQIRAGEHFKAPNVLDEADPTKLGSKSEVKLMPTDTGGIVTTLDPASGPAAVKFFTPFKATGATYYVGDDELSKPELATFTFDLENKALTSDQPEPVKVMRLPGARYAGSIDRLAARSVLRGVKAAKFSPIEIGDVEVGPNGLYAEGQIIADLPIIKDAPIDLVLDGAKLTVSHTFDLGEFKLPPPLKVTQSSLTVSASTSGDIAAAGRVDAEIEKVGKGFLAARAGTESGLALSGGFDFTSEMFQQAHVGFAYDAGHYTGEGKLTIASGKVAGLKGGSLNATFADDHFAASGHAEFDIPGVESADMSLTYDAAAGLTLTAEPTLKEMPGIKSGKLSVTVNQPAGGGAMKLSGHGTAQPDIPGIDAALTVAYDDGAFLAKVEVPFERGLIKGHIEAGATNAPVGDDGRPLAGGAPGGELHVFGAGSATLQITPWLAGTAAIRLLPNAEVEVHGDLTVEHVNLYEGKDLVDRDIVPMIHTDVPIFPPVVLGLGAGLKLKVGYGPGVLSGSIGITYNPSHADEAKLHGMLHMHASAYAGLELYTTVGLGLGVPGASITANVVLGGEMRLEANLDNDTQVDWSPTKGVVIDNTLSADLQPQLVITLSANVLATLGPFSHEFWREQLAGVKYGSGMNFGLSWPIHYEDGKPFNPSVDDIKVTPPQMAPEQVAKNILQERGKG